MVYKLSPKIRPRERIRGLSSVLSNADENAMRTDSEKAFGGAGDLTGCIETLPRFLTGHPPRRAQEARQRVFIPSKGSDTGSPRENATAARWLAGVDSGTPTR